MNIIDKILNKFRNRNGASYQEKRDNAHNWELIEKHIDKSSKNLLDIACDAGFYSLKAAEEGLFTVGLDILEPSIQKANEIARRKKQEHIAFMKMSLDSSNVSSLPKFDIILCLSVYQHLCRMFGEEDSRKMVAEIFTKCEKQLFFQIPSKKNKFGPDFPHDFRNDKVKIERYVNDLFYEIGECSVKLIGKKEEKPPTEPFRYLFLIEKLER